MQGVVLLIGTLVITLVSIQSIRQPGTHGYYRFFAWEFILLLYVLNMPVWDHEKDAMHQVIAGGFFMVSLFMVVTGALQLRLCGKPDESRNEVPMLHFEKTTVLVTTGIYRYIRHPIYGSLFYLCWGFFFKNPSMTGFAIAMVASAFLILAAGAEEAECIRFFGEQYRAYINRSKRLIPLIW
jgi:protein-S-isoprenylcysteine O-methyltransferase Ste14